MLVKPQHRALFEDFKIPATKILDNKTEGFAKPGILIAFHARAKIKPQQRCPIRGFYFCDKAEGGQNNGFTKPPDSFAKPPVINI